MKKIIFLLMAIAFYACNNNEVEITGLVKNPASSEIEVFYYKDFVLYEKETFTAELDEDNAFSLKLPKEVTNKVVYLSNNNRTIPLYITPKSSVYIEFDMENEDETPVIGGKNYYESQFFVQYQYDIEQKFGRSFIFEKATEHEPESFVEHMKESKNARKEYLKSYGNYDKLDEKFIKYIENSIEYGYYNSLMNYPSIHQHFNSLEEAPELPGNYFSFLENEKIFNDKLLNNSHYVNFLSNYLNYLMTESPFEGTTGEEYYKYQFNMARDNISGKSRDHILSQITTIALSRVEFETGEEIYNEYISLIEPGKSKDVVNAHYQKVLKLLPGNPAPDFEFEDINGEMVSLSDFSGKVVYLDFWASWCGPCMREVPYAKELKYRLGDKEDIVFLYVSVDEDENAWRNAVENNEIEGVHLFAGGWENPASKAYNVSGVPTFYVIGKDGKIFDNNPPRPSNENVDDVLLSALND